MARKRKNEGLSATTARASPSARQVSRKRSEPPSSTDGTEPQGSADLTPSDYYRRREKELLALQETTLDLNRLRNTSEVLGAIVRRARNLVGSAICYLSAYDPERRDFFVRAIEGAVSRRFAEIRVPRDLGSCHPIIESKRPFVTANYRDDPRFIHAATVDTALEGEGIVSMAAVPLLLDGQVLGILYIADRHPRLYAPEEVALLVSLGTHAALALENARLFEETRTALEALEIKTAETQEAIAVHEQLITLVAKGGSLEDVARMLAAVLHAGVVVLDHQYDTACLAVDPAGDNAGSKLGQARNRSLLLRALSESQSIGRSVPVTFPGIPPSIAMTIVSATQILGALVVWRQAPLSDHEIRTLERGAIVCGIVLLSLDRAAKGLERDIAELLSGLRNRNSEASVALARQMEQCGMDPRQPVIMLLVDVADSMASHVLQVIRGTSPTRRFIGGELEGRLLLLCPPADAPPVATAARKAVEQRTGTRINILQSAEFMPSTQLQDTFTKASRCLDLMRVLGRHGAICTQDELTVYAVMFAERSREELDAYIRHTIGALLEQDRKRNTNLTETMSCYLDSGYNTGMAARTLGIHENTLRQRLDSVERLLGNWRTAGRSFEVQTALKLHMLRLGLATK